MDTMTILESNLNEVNLRKLLAIPLKRVHDFVAEAIQLCQPMKVFVCNDSFQDLEYIRKTAIARGEESELAIPYHTVHFDGFFDQARDKEHTMYLVPEGESLGEHLLQMERKKGLELAKKRLRGSMNHKKMVVRFFCLGPVYSVFSIPCVQITDSFYVAHSEDLLYRRGYDYFKTIPEDHEIFWMLHSSGRLIHSVSIDWKRRGVAIDYKENTVYSYNTQYAGNTIGLKKPALRLAIRKASRESWLAEHMFLMAVNGPNGRKTYMTGAFPSGCGKTSTSMVPGACIVGDDLTYIKNIYGIPKAVNVERGIFGIIRSVSQKDDPVIWNVLNSTDPVIFTNVLIDEGEPYWLGDGREPPKRGINHSGAWFEGRKDENGDLIPLAHKNARYTISLGGLPNLDDALDDPCGVDLGAIIYGGRDRDTWVPVQESFDWVHGVVTMGASLESESTAATIGPSGIRKFQAFSNMDFMSIPLCKYVQNHLDFVENLKLVPKIFSVNYFQMDEEGNYLTEKSDKRVWLQWMDLRVHNEVKARKTPTGLIPIYEDLKELFKIHLDKDYTYEEYQKQFSMRVRAYVEKVDRVKQEYDDCVEDAPPILYETLDAQRERLTNAMEEYGEIIPPDKFEVI